MRHQQIWIWGSASRLWCFTCGSWLQALLPARFCVQVLVSPPLSLSCFSGQAEASLWVGQGWSTVWEHRGKEQGAQRWRQVVAPDGGEGTSWWGARVGERKSWREAGDEEMGWNDLNEKTQEKETWPFSWAPHTSHCERLLSVCNGLVSA